MARIATTPIIAPPNHRSCFVRSGSGNGSGVGGSFSSSSSSSTPKSALRRYLAALGLPPGLLSSVLQSHRSTKARLWLLDDSFSMKARDSHVGLSDVDDHYNTTDAGIAVERVDNVTRWDELSECVSFHTKMASKCWLPTKYLLISSGVKFSICWGTHAEVPAEMGRLKAVMEGVTSNGLDSRKCPLAARVRGVRSNLMKEASSMGKQHVTVMICTQGVPTDGMGQSGPETLDEFRSELKALLELKFVRVIVRLCTDDEGAKDMFNGMDCTLDSVDLLDDYWGEALEVHLHNPWLTYGPGLHRLREAGLAPDLVDDLDERPLTLNEIYQLSRILFMGEEDDKRINFPSPSSSPGHPHNSDRFFRTLLLLVEREKLQWNPVKRRLAPWIDVDKLRSIHGVSSKGTSCPPPPMRQPLHRFSSSSRQEPPPGSTHRCAELRCSDTWREEPSSSARAAGTASGKPEPPFQSSQSYRHPPRETTTQRASELGQPGRRFEESRCQSQTSQAKTTTGAAAAGAAAAKHPNPQRGVSSSPTLEETLRRWSHRLPDYKSKTNSLPRLLLTIPQTFPPTNTKVEDHEYFGKWKPFDGEAFKDANGDELKELLRRAVRKARLFLHEDKLPKELTENQALLFKTIWHVISEQQEEALA